MEKNPQQITRIKGLSEKRWLPRLGKIRLGVKAISQQGREYPKEVGYFVCPPEVQAVYGEKPTEIDIMFPVEDETVIFPQALKWYGSTQGLKCKGDGEIAIRRWEDCTPEQQKKSENGGSRDPNNLIEISCPCEKLDRGECSQRGNLMVLLPKVSLGGVYQIDTGSGQNIININSYIDYLRSISQGRISLIPLKLRRIEQEMKYTDDKGKAHKTKHYLLQLELKITLDEILNLRKDSQSIPGIQYLIEPPKEDGKDFPEAIEYEETGGHNHTPPSIKMPPKASQEVKILPEPEEEPIPEPINGFDIDPTPAESEPPVSKGKGKTTNFKFLEVMKEMKEKVGEEAYYTCLKNFGYEKSNQVTKRKEQEMVYRALKILAEKITPDRKALLKEFQIALANAIANDYSQEQELNYCVSNYRPINVFEELSDEELQKEIKRLRKIKREEVK